MERSAWIACGHTGVTLIHSYDLAAPVAPGDWRIGGEAVVTR